MSGGAGPVGAKGVYGQLGVASANNTPGARDAPFSFTDPSGNFWLFGGYGLDTYGNEGDLNDLWKYTNSKWTWMGGSPVFETKGIYGTKGVAGAGNIPGGRYGGMSWTDPSGNFWLFGGLGLDSEGNRGDLDDLWRYSNGQWTWMGGPNLADIVGTVECPVGTGVYGMEGVPDAGNWPGARVGAMTWADASGNLWLFGGEGCDANGMIGILNDLWKYSAGEWTWMNGSDTSSAEDLFQPGVYGTQGIASPDNVPGQRTAGVTWTDANGNLWLFGGQGNDSTGGTVCSAYGGPCLLNDLWRYANGEWTWMGGSNLNNAPGIYGTMGTATSDNIPGARWLAASSIDAQGNVWLFGGKAFDAKGDLPSELNDLWKLSNGEWTWISGSNLASDVPLGVYGTMGTPSVGNVPMQREWAVAWTDRSSNLWLFGGDADLYCVDRACPAQGKMNDLWEYEP
jgi:N-acetylneuraminic acid mutarotase